jgi:O-acetyl-ADP-ribose deacetylase (regulator of RNase III)
MTIQIKQSDITTSDDDAIVNAVNEMLHRGVTLF